VLFYTAFRAMRPVHHALRTLQYTNNTRWPISITLLFMT